MLTPRRHRLATVFILAVYLAATHASGLFHSHAVEPADSHSCAHACGASHAHSTAPSDVPASAGDVSSGVLRGVGEHDDCAVCRFLGQRVVPAVIGQLEHASDLTLEVAVAHPIRTSIPAARTLHSRAPPQAG